MMAVTTTAGDAWASVGPRLVPARSQAGTAGAIGPGGVAGAPNSNGRNPGGAVGGDVGGEVGGAVGGAPTLGA